MTQLSPTALEAAENALYSILDDDDWTGDRPKTIATAAITAYLAQAGKEGWVMVPSTPTKEMIYDGNTTIDDCIDFWNYDSGSGYSVEPHAAASCYRAMIAARPSPGAADE